MYRKHQTIAATELYDYIARIKRNSFLTLNFLTTVNINNTVLPDLTPRTYLLTPWCRVLLEKLTGLQLVKTFPAFLWNP